MARNILKSRQAKYGVYAGTYVVVILAVLVAVNYLANRYSKSYDSTANKQFSLSEQTEKIAKNLKHDVKITYFDDTSRFPQARDLLGRYAELSPKISVQYVDPVKKPQQARADGYRRDLLMLISSNGRQEEAKSLSEDEITGALIRSQKTGERNVCFVNAAGEKSLDDDGPTGFSTMKQLLEHDNYKTRTVNLRPSAPQEGKTVAIGKTEPEGPVTVPSDCTALIVGGPQLDYPQPVVDALKKYVEGGGHAMFMLDTPMKLGRGNPAPENAALVKVLTEWGVTPQNDLVLDLSGIGGMFGAGPEIPMVLQYESDPITQPLQRIPTAYPLSRSLDVKSPAKGTADKLIATGEESIAVDKIGPGGEVNPKEGKKGPLTIAAKGTTAGTPAGRWIVVGSSGWAENRALNSRTLGNRDLFMNMVNWLTADEDLISIRPKTTEDRPLNMTTQKLNMVFWLSVVIFPLGIVGMGLATWWKRR